MIKGIFTTIATMHLLTLSIIGLINSAWNDDGVWLIIGLVVTSVSLTWLMLNTFINIDYIDND